MLPVVRFKCTDSSKRGEQAKMMHLDAVRDPMSGKEPLRRWRYGRIVMRAGQLVEIQRRLTCGSVSVAQVWWQTRFGRNDDEVCWLDYHQPLGMPAFLTLDYVRSGTRAGYKTFAGALHVLDEIARLRGATAIVAHVSNHQISDRLLARLGWQQHLQHWQGRHWIRRFYDGYPESVLHRYLPPSPALAVKADDPCGSVWQFDRGAFVDPISTAWRC
jgi:hypothetical protein